MLAWDGYCIHRGRETRIRGHSKRDCSLSRVILELEDGTKERVSIEDYREAVWSFADEIEEFYNACSPKVFWDDYDRDGYLGFWTEWHRRRNEVLPLA